MPDLDRLFHPGSVAIVGISNDPNKWGGANWVKTLLELGFEGRIYPISPTMSEFKGLRVYRSIEEVPDSIDLVLISVPARFTPQLMEQCARKHVSFAQFFTAGFSEAGSEGATLEKKVVEIAAKGGVRILGPNCMGVYCPSSHFGWRLDFPRAGGAVAFLSQSGLNAVQVATLGAAREVRFSKVISYGNAADLNETDFIKYFADDPESRVITAYIEGVTDGQQFIQSLRKAAQIKPVVVLKGGRSKAGARATASHTAALAGTTTIWASALRQAGAIEVQSLDELLDVAMAFLCLPALEHSGVALIGAGGGPGVVGADECEDAGLTVPPLPEEAVEALRQFNPQEGTSLRNPVDSHFGFGQTRQQLQETMAIIGSCPEIASLIIHLGIDSILHFLGRRELANATNAIAEAARDCARPVTMVLRTSGLPEATKVILEEQRGLVAAGIPVYPTIRRAAQAISKILQYQHSRP